MPLHIYYSDRIEDLADHLKGKLVAEREKSDPFDFPQVVVPNRNISRWLQIRVFADTPELCAGVGFPFMEKRLTELLLRNLELPEGKSFSPIPDNGYANAILAALLAPKGHPGFADFAPFRRYVAGEEGAGRPLDVSTQKGARMAWQLATRLADLMDQYEVRRPEIVANWLAGRNADGTGTPRPGSTEAGEAALARALWGKPDGAFPDGGERLSLRQLYDRVERSAPAGDPETVYFFGMSTLSILQAKILVWLAQKHEVIFYHNNVCLEYWGDIETKSERVKRLGRAHAGDEDIQVENPLLSQWGAAGRETMRLLVDLEEGSDGSVAFEWKCIADRGRPRPGTMLGRIQDSIRRRTGETGTLPQDASLQIVGAPGIRREVEMVYNAILGAVWKPGGSGDRPWDESGPCSFSDIAVLVPDMAAYRPMIEAVFDARDEIPFGLVDTTASEESAYLAGFLALADLARRGLTRETLFALLDNPCVQAALAFTPDDAADWRGVVARIGAFDGFEAREGESFTAWDWALSRLRLATVADAVTRDRGTEGAEPVPLAPVNDRTVLRLSEIVELLHRRVGEAFLDAGTSKPRRLPCGPRPDEPKGSEDGPEGSEKPDEQNWRRVLSGLAREFLAVPKDDEGKDDELEGSVRRQILKALAGLAALPGEQSAELAVAAVEHFAGGLPCRRGGYLTNGVTIAGLQPMRPVPFRQVFVLGLGEGGFPGRKGAVDMLDVRGAGWKLGDVSLPKTNRFLFLETLMAVRDRLVLSYPDRDIAKDAELFPSGIVRELETFAGSIAETGTFEELNGYPLLERGERRTPPGAPNPVRDVEWSKDDPFAGLVPTYSKTARRTAAALAGAGPAPDPASAKVGPAPASAGAATGGRARREVSAKELAEFLKEPLHAALEFGFGVAEKGTRDGEIDPDSPLGVPDGPVKWGLQADWLAGDGELDAPFRKLQLEGKAPTGFLGDFARGRFAEQVAESRKDLLAFAKEFGLGTASCKTMRQRFPANLSRGAGESASDVLFVSATPNWREDGAEASVLVAGYLGESPPRLPPDAVLAPLVAFLMRVAKERPDGKARTLRVGVLDVEHGSRADWRWTLDPATAGKWLERLALRYLDYLDRPDADGLYADFTYRRLAKALEEEDDDIDWEAVLADMAKEDFKSRRGKNAPPKRYDGGLVVEQSVGRYRRDPTAEELERLYDEFYELPLSGVAETKSTSGERKDAAETKGGAQ